MHLKAPFSMHTCPVYNSEGYRRQSHSTLSSYLIAVTSYLIPIELVRKVIRKKHNGSALGWACSPRSDRNNRSHPANATQICLQPQTDSSWHTRCHTDTNIKDGECFCSKAAGDSPFNHLIKLRHNTIISTPAPTDFSVCLHPTSTP